VHILLASGLRAAIMPSVDRTDFYDVVVLGGGSAGYAAARTAYAQGRKVAVVEGAAEVGGLCILRGCMPTKALLQAAEVQHLVRKSPLWGVRGKAGPPNFRAVMARKDFLIEDFARYRRDQLTDGRFDFLRHAARFRNPSEIELDSGRVIRASSFIIATGSTQAVPDLPGLREAGYWTSDDALALRKLPKSILVLGGGAVAVEFAQFFARMGVEVTLVQRSAQLLKDFDPDAADVLLQVFQREGMRVYTRTRLQSAGRTQDGARFVEFLHEEKLVRVEAEQILFALGRMPATQSLELERAEVATDSGRIRTNAEMRTTQPHIFAAGDCTGPFEIVNVAIQQGEIAAWNASHPDRPRSIDYRLVSHVVFTDPPLAMTGMTETKAQSIGMAVRTARYPFSDHGKSMIMDALDGFVKLLTDATNGEIVGACCVGPMGGELIHEIVVAMSQHLTAAQLAAIPHYHPTLAEIWTYPAEELS